MINFEQKTIWSLSYADVQFHGYIINTGIYMYNQGYKTMNVLRISRERFKQNYDMHHLNIK